MRWVSVDEPAGELVPDLRSRAVSLLSPCPPPGSSPCWMPFLNLISSAAFGFGHIQRAFPQEFLWQHASRPLPLGAGLNQTTSYQSKGPRCICSDHNHQLWARWVSFNHQTHVNDLTDNEIHRDVESSVFMLMMMSNLNKHDVLVQMSYFVKLQTNADTVANAEWIKCTKMQQKLQ